MVETNNCWAIDIQGYHDRIHKLVTKLKELFIECESPYFLFWVEDYHKKRIGCSYSGHYSEILEDSAVTNGIRDYFATSWVPPGQREYSKALNDKRFYKTSSRNEQIMSIAPLSAKDELVASEFFQKLIDPNNQTAMPRLDWYLPPIKKARISRPHLDL
ncbi:hypothetical protein Ndes2437B_g06613 [Nannochloris sp. 'desiccata']